MENFSYEAFRELKLPTEKNIMSNWKRDVIKPIVSVLCATFNQQQYIEDAVRGFLIQKTDFPFEIIIHDDASTDETPNILKKYASLYPNLIRLVLQNENQYSQDKKIIPLIASYAVGDYFALCEGDDFWIDENKLSHQKSIIDRNPECSLIVHQCFLMKKGRVEAKPSMSHGSKQRIIEKGEVVSLPGQFSPTASYLIKREVFDALPKWFKEAPVGDYFLECYSFKLGEVIYIPCAYSVYRIQAEGSWSLVTKASGQKMKTFALSMYNSLMLMREDEFFKNSDVDKKIAASLLGIAKGALVNSEYSEFKSNIEESYFLHGKLSNPQQVLFLLRNFPRIARALFILKRK